MHSQNVDLENAISLYDSESYKESLTEFNKIDTIAISSYDKATWYFYYADIQSILDKQDIAYKYARKAEHIFESLNEREDAIDTKLLILSIVFHQNSLKIDEQPIIDDILSYAKKEDDSIALMRIYFRIGHAFTQNYNREKANYYYRTVLEKTKDSLDIAYANMNIGSVYSTIAPKNQDSALFYAKKAIPTLIIKNDLASITANYNNQAEAYYYKQEYRKAIEYLITADSINLNKNDKKTKIILYENLAKNYDSLKDYKNAAIYLSKFISLKDSINDEAQNIAINETNAKYNTEKIRADKLEVEAAFKQLETYNLRIEAEKKRTTYQLIIALFILTLVIISAYLIQKNTRKKQLLAEQAKDLEAQKVSTLLKEQELASIDAMIEGQEKERKRIAEDLHDDLGALMATVKLHFDNIETAQNEDAVQKTSSLLDEAYEKIRTIAHAKNAGVIANQGLLVAVENMSSKITDSNKLDIEVIAHGLEDRLENSLELSLFRMIQELIANIIKHAEATNATIQLTQHEKNLNIIVEDNGKGFDHSKIKNAGIGLETIKKRIAHLNGKLTIDSTLGKGTTILVDVPLT